MIVTWEIWSDDGPAKFASLVASKTTEQAAENELKRIEDMNPAGKFKIMRRRHPGRAKGE